MDKTLMDQYLELVEKIQQAILEKCPFEEFSVSEFYMMKLLTEYEKRNINATTKSISEYLGISKPAVSQMLNCLEKKSFIKRSINEEDRRQICIETTEKGKELVLKQSSNHEVLFNGVMDKVGESDIKELFRIMNNILNAVKER